MTIEHACPVKKLQKISVFDVVDEDGDHFKNDGEGEEKEKNCVHLAREKVKVEDEKKIPKSFEFKVYKKVILTEI